MSSACDGGAGGVDSDEQPLLLEVLHERTNLRLLELTTRRERDLRAQLAREHAHRQRLARLHHDLVWVPSNIPERIRGVSTAMRPPVRMLAARTW